jgi:hypothetical protein
MISISLLNLGLITSETVRCFFTIPKVPTFAGISCLDNELFVRYSSIHF